ncbi:unnamed protein product [Paramecium sonneborni]|uniref:Uncharacterized protein n=1 Tax=Paramecium sonneborni TaxID=65129 RepID=A0A8S1NXS2_9CILI|nr:unnamed protein product [Paramecium sonneborni]
MNHLWKYIGNKIKIKNYYQMRILRLEIHAPVMQIVATDRICKVSYIPKEMIKNIFYKSAKKNDGIFGAEGDKGEIQGILQQYIQICSKGNKNQLVIDKFGLQSNRLIWQKHKKHE